MSVVRKRVQVTSARCRVEPSGHGKFIKVFRRLGRLKSVLCATN